MNKIVKKIIAASLCVAMVVPLGSVNVYAWSPTPECFDFSKLEDDKGYILGNGEKCGFKRESNIDVVKYSSLGEYVDILTEKFYRIAFKRKTDGNLAKLHNIKMVLTLLSACIESNLYKRGNLFFASMYNDADDPDRFVDFINIKEIEDKNVYNETYFNEIKSKADDNIKGMKTLIHEYFRDNPCKNIFFCDAITKATEVGCAAISVVVGTLLLFKKLNQNSFIKKALDMASKNPLAEDLLKKKIELALNKEFEITEENLRKVPKDTLKKILEEVEKEVNKDEFEKINSN